MPHGEVESRYAWMRLMVSLLLSTIGGVGMWSVVVALPAVQSEFGVARADASLPYTLTMIGFGLASIGMGRLADRFGIMVPVITGTICMALGYVAAARAGSLWLYALAQGLLIGTGSAATGDELRQLAHEGHGRRLTVLPILRGEEHNLHFHAFLRFFVFDDLFGDSGHRRFLMPPFLQLVRKP